MGGAVFTSLDGQANFAALPERVEVALRGALGAAGDKLGVSRKTDRLPTAEEPSYLRQLIRVSTTTRAGNHEIVRVRPFIRVAGNLSLTAVQTSPPIFRRSIRSACSRNRAGRRYDRRCQRRKRSRMPKSPS